MKYLGTLLAMVLLATPMWAEDTDHEVEISVQDSCLVKYAMLRDHFKGDAVTYDMTGKLVGGAAGADWEKDDLLLLLHAKVTRTSIVLEASRFDHSWDPATQLTTMENGHKLTITIERNPEFKDEDDTERILGKIFVAREVFPRFLYQEPTPDCPPEGTAGKPKGYVCKMKVGVAPPAVAVKPVAVNGGPDAFIPEDEILRVGQGVSAPRVQHQVELRCPDVPSDIAGDVLLSIVVGADGRAHNITVQRPLGHGCDEKAVEAIKKWTFVPSVRDGRPVSVRVNIEMSVKR